MHGGREEYILEHNRHRLPTPLKMKPIARIVRYDIIFARYGFRPTRILIRQHHRAVVGGGKRDGDHGILNILPAFEAGAPHPATPNSIHLHAEYYICLCLRFLASVSFSDSYLWYYCCCCVQGRAVERRLVSARPT